MKDDELAGYAVINQRGQEQAQWVPTPKLAHSRMVTLAGTDNIISSCTGMGNQDNRGSLHTLALQLHGDCDLRLGPGTKAPRNKAILINSNPCTLVI